MNMIKISIAAMALAVGFAAVPAIAQSRDSFQNVDGNGDGSSSELIHRIRALRQRSGRVSAATEGNGRSAMT